MNRPPSPTSSPSDEEYASAQSDEEDEDYEVDLESPMNDAVQSAPPMAPMIPPDCTNPLEALNSFTNQFANRYHSVSLIVSNFVTSNVIITSDY